MGTMLQARGLAMGEAPELAALEHPDWLLDIHRAYVEAGSQILCANTFGANREKLRRTGRTVEEVVPAAVALAKQAAAGRALVALDVGPIGQLLEPTGTLQFEEAVDIFKEMVRAAVPAGADLVMVGSSSWPMPGDGGDHDRSAGVPGRAAGGEGVQQPAGDGGHDL